MQQPVTGPATCLSRLVSQNGKTVRLEVERMDQQWALRVIGHCGQVSEWTDGFATATEAVHAGLNAIHLEGIDDFYEDPVFSYLELAGQLLKPRSA